MLYKHMGVCAHRISNSTASWVSHVGPQRGCRHSPWMPCCSLRLWPWGCLCSVQGQFEDTMEKNEELLGELYSDPQLQTLLNPECGPGLLDMQPPDKQGDDRQRYGPCMIL